MAKDPYSIGFGYQQFSTRPMMKALKLGANASGPFVELTIENLHNQTYPLAQSYYVYVNRKPGTAVDPKIKEFLRYVLSREGQTAIAKHGKYLPLTPERAKAALALIE
jgi:phosphate transport system substrate-binding protein